ncbi:sodium/hydrogen exchanger 2-like, partial [Diaphorina citri]|uniref:Sodium/hydrogen exchanger 2-like n=2 Tax=Diaphorina citri TaxID=121845 RepID=A0A3Q0J705_DIACI
LSLWAVGQSGIFGPHAPLLEMMLFAALISAVDPVAVLAVFEEIHVNEILYIVVFGESLLNDAVTVVLYHMFEAYTEMGHNNVLYVDLLSGLASFFVVAVGGTVIGVIWGFLTGFVTRFTNEVRVIEPIFIFVMAYLAYLTAEIFHMSGILALVLVGVGRLPGFHMTPRLNQIFPESCLLIFVGVVIGVLLFLTTNIHIHPLTPDTFFLYMLPPIILDAGYFMPNRLFFDHLGTILLFAVIGTIFNTLSIGTERYGQDTGQRAHVWNTAFVILTIFFCSLYRTLGRPSSKSLRQTKLVPVQSPPPMFVTTTIAVIYFTVFFQGITIKPLVKILNVKTAERRKPSMNERIHERLMDHVMAGIEDILGRHGNHHVRDRFKRFDNRFIRPYLLRDHQQGAEPKILETYSKLAMKDAMEFMRRNASTIGGGSITGTDSMSAIFRNYTTGHLNGSSKFSHSQLMDHVMAGIEDILGRHGNHHVRDRFKRFDNRFIRPYLLRDHQQGAEPKILETYSKLAMKDAMEFMRRNASTIGGGSITGTDSMSAIFRNYTTGHLNGSSSLTQLDNTSTWNIDLQELDYNPSKKDLTDAKIHHLLSEELCMPQKRDGSKQSHVTFPGIQQNGSAKQFTSDYIDEVLLESEVSSKDGKTTEWECGGITFSANPSYYIDEVLLESEVSSKDGKTTEWECGGITFSANPSFAKSFTALPGAADPSLGITEATDRVLAEITETFRLLPNARCPGDDEMVCINLAGGLEGFGFESWQIFRDLSTQVNYKMHMNMCRRLMADRKHHHRRSKRLNKVCINLAGGLEGFGFESWQIFRDLSTQVNYKLHMNMCRRLMADRKHHHRRSKRLNKDGSKQSHVTFPGIQQNGSAKQFTSDYIDEVLLESEVSSKDGKTTEWECGGITFSANPSYDISKCGEGVSERERGAVGGEKGGGGEAPVRKGILNNRTAKPPAHCLQTPTEPKSLPAISPISRRLPRDLTRELSSK